jgi:hypothetical protein
MLFERRIRKAKIISGHSLIAPKPGMKIRYWF